MKKVGIIILHWISASFEAPVRTVMSTARDQRDREWMDDSMTKETVLSPFGGSNAALAVSPD